MKEVEKKEFGKKVYPLDVIVFSLGKVQTFTMRYGKEIGRIVETTENGKDIERFYLA